MIKPPITTSMTAIGIVGGLAIQLVFGDPEPMTMAALDAGLHVLCEKPMAFDAAQAREMAEKAEAFGPETMRSIEKQILLQTIEGPDTVYKWAEICQTEA